MTQTPATPELAAELEREFGHLFAPNEKDEKISGSDIEALESVSGGLTDDEKAIVAGDCVIRNGVSICRRNGGWVVC